MKKPNLPTGEWNHSKHGTPEGCPQFGIYAEGTPNDFAIVKAEEPVAQAIAALPDLLAALEEMLDESCKAGIDTMPGDDFAGFVIACENAKAALTKAGYTF